MSTPSMKILRRYIYDPLDRLIGVGLLQTDSTQRFYQEDHLTTELGQQIERKILRHQAQPLAQSQSEAGMSETMLLATDQAHSLLKTVSSTSPRQFAYTAYGHHPAESGLSHWLGFNGESPDEITGTYPLGKGNRFYNPCLMRFTTPDDFSPFDEGGINAYAYCGNDPVNNFDPSGEAPIWRPWLSSVIVKNPLKQIRPTTATISKQSSINLGNHPISKPSPRHPTLPLVDEVTLLEPNFKPTQSSGNKKLKPTQPALDNRKSVRDAIRYDEIIKKTPDFNTVATTRMVDRLNYYDQEVKNFFTSGRPRHELSKLNSILRNVEAEIKQYSVKQHMKRIRNLKR
ncbi:RHS repeat-associated core domain-containing protein [Pseudomonas sp. YuFO8]|uniref:RHS repeat-associated core domain-containing protein n=1 Tax=Pseudomonas sp. YuFO8 TaxID=3095361 RepID=UPI002B2507DF|nr:RHS repeat-associated core domain-containing protein [Pseudomonas sp. YuFO8]MEB2621196.1 RHS repeat-associated core domain-containing protein [Pseudomonas sp. YuFO8]